MIEGQKETIVKLGVLLSSKCLDSKNQFIQMELPQSEDPLVEA